MMKPTVEPRRNQSEKFAETVFQFHGCMANETFISVLHLQFTTMIEETHDKTKPKWSSIMTRAWQTFHSWFLATIECYSTLFHSVKYENDPPPSPEPTLLSCLSFLSSTQHIFASTRPSWPFLHDIHSTHSFPNTKHSFHTPPHQLTPSLRITCFI